MSISREVLAKYITKGCMFLETGCRWGTNIIRAREMGAVAADGCETDRLICAAADVMVEEVGQSLKGVSVIFCEDSVEWLAAYWGGHREVVFLDAHTETKSPVLEELEAISDWDSGKPSVILIDDLRCMGGWGISGEQLIEAIYKIGGYSIDYEDGVKPKDIMAATLCEK